MGALGETDPVREYVKNITPLGGDNHFYSDDRLLRLDADIDGDGVNEVFITMGRDRNGKQGNAWSIYRTDKDPAELIGGATFNDGGIYVGRLEEVQAHGILSFWSSGGGEGQIMFTTLKEGRMSEVSIGVVERDAKTGELKGREILNKYFGSGSKFQRQTAQELRAEELQQKYGLKVESETYSQALDRHSIESDALRAAEELEKAAKRLPKMEGSIAPEASPAPVELILARATAIAQAAPVPGRPLTEAAVPATVDPKLRRNIIISLVLILVLASGHLFYRARLR